jgi:SAM-dependent methyltransferase
MSRDILKEIINESDDAAFDGIYHPSFRVPSSVHWTPIYVALTVVEWLKLDEHARVLDIGSGVGKFCAVASKGSKGKFVGVEKRKNLFAEAERIARKYTLENVEYLHADITEIDFRDFTAFYYYNPFCEQIATSGWIDQTLTFSDENYYTYQQYVLHQFEGLPIGTRIVTYCSEDLIFSSSFRLQNMLHDGQLQLWVKER